MLKNQKSSTDGIQNFLCPFTKMQITQRANGKMSHMGVMANDIASGTAGLKAPYFAPIDCKCVKIYKTGGGSMWQSLDKVRFANGDVDYATFIIYHDESQNCKIGQIVRQGQQIGNMGRKGKATGVHCHFEVAKGLDTSFYKNDYDVYTMNNEIDIFEACFMDDTEILNYQELNWKYTKDIDNSKDDFKIGDYITLDDMFIRSGPGEYFSTKLVENITKNGKDYVLNKDPKAFAIYKKGIIFTALKIVKNSRGIWGKSPSGWICLKGKSGKVYCELAKC